MAGSNFLHKGPCPVCGSKDNLAYYDDGHTYCFTPGCPGPGKDDKPQGKRGKVADSNFVQGEVRALSKRGLTEETCAKWNYTCGTFKDRPVQVANYYRNNKLVAQKIRFPDKDFTVKGDLKKAGLYGQHLWRDGGKMVVITEGEIDALSVSQLQGNKWPVVSVPNGAQGAAKAIARELEWLSKFEKIILMFDQDEPGRQATQECAKVLPVGKAYIATLPMKDANEMLVAGRGSEVIDAIWGAKQFRPDGIVTLSDLRDEVMKEPETGLPWCFPQLNALTFGRRYGECYAVGAGTGVGKTDLLTQQIEFDVTELKQKVGIFFFEQRPVETVKRIAGKEAERCFHIPNAGWTQEELAASVQRLEAGGKLFLNDHFGMAEWDSVRESIRFLHHAEGVNIFYLDHLTALASGIEDERTELERIMADIGKLIQELNIILTFVSHLATPEGKPHEEGGRVMIRHFKGSRAIGYWAHFMFGLERDQQADDETVRQTTTLRILKDRYTGRSTGSCVYLRYQPQTGILRELDNNLFDDLRKDETGGVDYSEEF